MELILKTVFPPLSWMRQEPTDRWYPVVIMGFTAGCQLETGTALDLRTRLAPQWDLTESSRDSMRCTNLQIGLGRIPKGYHTKAYSTE